MIYVLAKKPFKSFTIVCHAPVPNTKRLFQISGSILRVTREMMMVDSSSIVERHFAAVRRGTPPVLPSEYDKMSIEERRLLFENSKVAAIYEEKGHLVIIPTELLNPEPLYLRYFSERAARNLKEPLVNDEVWMAISDALKRSK